MQQVTKPVFFVALAAALGLVSPEPMAAPPVLDATPPPPLGTLAIPPVPGLYDGNDPIIVNRDAAVALGKALFWDMQTGSDGLACASCHFQAGADNRVKNVVSPGILHASAPTGSTFEPVASGGFTSGPNYTLRLGDFPFHQFNDPSDRDSGVKFTTDDVVSSPGTFAGDFVTSTRKRRFLDVCDRRGDHPIFNVGGLGTRKVEPRNSPTMINAVFQYRSFWDGRANNVFNGNNPFGLRDGSASVIRLLPDGRVDTGAKLALINSALASQAVGPPLSDFEMSCSDRTFADLGRKLLTRQPLALQKVHAQDSVLAPYRGTGAKGLTGTYADLVQQAFNRSYWAARGRYPVKNSSRLFTQMEANFSMFWGLAIQAYESTLISDNAPYDRGARDAGGFPVNLTALQKLGLKVFIGQGRAAGAGEVNGGHCINCHKGPDFTGAGSPLRAEAEENGLVERMAMGDGGIALYDNGFYNIGVTPTSQDIAVGGTDPFGNPLSFSEQYVKRLSGLDGKDPFEIDPCTFELPVDSLDCTAKPAPSDRIAVKGAFKTPSLRNVSLTGPYMHNGSMATLEQVVEFYNRGGNFSNAEKDPDIEPLGLTAREKAGLVAFLKSLTDPRVSYERAPFDHPQLRIPTGHVGDETSVTARGASTLAQDEWLEIPAVGKRGRDAPLQPFDQGLAP